MLNPFIDLLATLIDLYAYCVIAWMILTTLISFRIVDRTQPAVIKIMYALNRLCSKPLYKMRKYLPDLGAIDIAPIVLILLLDFLKKCLIQYFYNL